MRTMARRPACAAYAASDALVFPVEAQATARAPRRRAWVIATVMPRSLKEPVGFSPSCLKKMPPRSYSLVAGGGDGLAEAPDAALVDRIPAGAAAVEDVAADGDGVALDAEEVPAVARVADLVERKSFAAADALEPHTRRTPSRAIAETIAVEAMSPKAACMASPARRAMSSVSQMAARVGPEPLIAQPSAPAFIAARLASGKRGISGARRGSA